MKAPLRLTSRTSSKSLSVISRKSALRTMPACEAFAAQTSLLHPFQDTRHMSHAAADEQVHRRHLA